MPKKEQKERFGSGTMVHFQDQELSKKKSLLDFLLKEILLVLRTKKKNVGDWMVAELPKKEHKERLGSGTMVMAKRPRRKLYDSPCQGSEASKCYVSLYTMKPS